MTAMLYLLFYLGKDRYVIKATDVIEIVPLIKFTHIPQTPEYVAGMFNYRGTAVPVVDMRRLTNSRLLNDIMSTRVILVNYVTNNDEGHVLGLIIERVTDMIHLEDDGFVAQVIANDESSYISEVVTDQAGIIQKIDVEKILPDHVRDVLFTKEQEKKISRVS